MLHFFRSYGIRVFVVVFLLGGLTWLHAFFPPDTPPDTEHATFLFLALARPVGNVPALAAWSGFIFTLFIAAMLTVFNNRLRLIEKTSFLPALCYILLVGGVPEIHRLCPEVVAAAFLIFAFVRLVRSFESDRLSYQYFIVPMLISVAGLFYRYAFLYLPVVWLSLLFFRPGYWREWVFTLLGFALPLFLAFCWFYLVEDDYSRIATIFRPVSSPPLPAPRLSHPSLLFFAAGIAAVLFTLGRPVRRLGSRGVIIRNAYYLLFLIAGVAALVVLVVPAALPFAWYLAAFPLSLIPADYLATAPSTRRAAALLLFLFASVALAQIIKQVLHF